MARGDDNDKQRVEELERRASIHEREVIALADTIKELVGQIQQLAEAQVSILDSHDDLLQKIVEMDRKLNGLSENG